MRIVCNGLPGSPGAGRVSVDEIARFGWRDGHGAGSREKRRRDRHGSPGRQMENNPERKAQLEAAGYNYEAVQAAVNQKAKGGASAKKSVAAVAQEVLLGKWGNNPARKKALEVAGYDYSAVQAEVNRLCRK